MAVVSLISNCAHLSRLVLFCSRESFCHSIDCLSVSLFFFTEIGNNILFFKLSCSLDLVTEITIDVAVLTIILLLSQHTVVARSVVLTCIYPIKDDFQHLSVVNLVSSRTADSLHRRPLMHSCGVSCRVDASECCRFLTLFVPLLVLTSGLLGALVDPDRIS